MMPEPQPKPTKTPSGKPQSTPTPQPSLKPEPQPKPEPTSKPEPSQPSGKCEIKCLGGPYFQVCANGGATPFRMRCAPGTTCHIVSGQAACF
ncbi:hypothetical protein K7432_014471 [Basidiobolus ranarum]|uniref:Uncharacterized protein n=1 Tax=Basidiobolus ranarum TaxID=34480 RepID=A0ABR2VPH0_9FUNG